MVLSYAEIKAVATGNPLIRDQAEVAADVARLSRLSDNHARARRSLRGRLHGVRQRLHALDVAIERLDDLLQRRVDTRGDAFRFTTVDGSAFTERTPAAEWLRDRVAVVHPSSTDTWTPLGTLGGVSVEASRWVSTMGSQVEMGVADDTETFKLDPHELWHAAPSRSRRGTWRRTGVSCGWSGSWSACRTGTAPRFGTGTSRPNSCDAARPRSGNRSLTTPSSLRHVHG